ncbi:hypothetical protein Tco_0556481 [Tanacetum coccineum]
MVKNKGLVSEPYEWDEKNVSSYDNEMIEVKVLMALDDDENVVVGKESAKNGEWVKTSMRKVHTLLTMEDNDDRKSFLDYLCTYLTDACETNTNEEDDQNEPGDSFLSLADRPPGGRLALQPGGWPHTPKYYFLDFAFKLLVCVVLGHGSLYFNKTSFKLYLWT